MSSALKGMLRHLSGYFISLTVSINKKIYEELCMYAAAAAAVVVFVVVVIIHQSIQVYNHWIWMEIVSKLN
jgi:hypothetical protein